ncbi:DNA-binding protein, partial [Avibacterium paragallinarum]
MVKAHLKIHYSAKELLDLSLNCLPNSVQGILYQAKKNEWKGRKRSGQGGGIEFELSSLPVDVQAEILLKNTTLPEPSAV